MLRHDRCRVRDRAQTKSQSWSEERHGEPDVAVADVQRREASPTPRAASTSARTQSGSSHERRSGTTPYQSISEREQDERDREVDKPGPLRRRAPAAAGSTPS